ncbi:MAG TPA: CpsB/CapC family capsule biosynthesis tyrosine phosphatase [Solirubrobacteraceae bacterium]|nr:CpsB/CapC family capsule biosynthesis tyrosine phosphatase [Solirubrobacteraceae bacterium]
MMRAVIDLHCHVLPGLDDGPPTLDEALAQLREAAARGMAAMVATPHVSWQFPQVTAQRIAAGVEAVNAALQAAQIELEVLPGAEVQLSRWNELDETEAAGLRLGGGPWTLVELPFVTSPSLVESSLFAIGRGRPALLAHVERCSAFHEDRELAQRLSERGVLLQVTAGSLVGRFGRRAEQTARRLLEDGHAHVVSSDTHDARRRPPGVREELGQAGLGSLAEWTTVGVPEAIIRGETPPPRPDVAPGSRRKRLLRRVKRG